jgi:acetylornithine deacetylase/succinyl-diaminopimelate desuccinylase-like protein
LTERGIYMDMTQELITFAQKAVRTRSYSDEEGNFARLIQAEMGKLGYDEVCIDTTGNVVGRTARDQKSSISIPTWIR